MKDLSTAWVQWALSLPPLVNPMLDKTGENCMVGQRDEVWMLAGGFFGGDADRTCAVPEGKELLIPIANSFWIDTPGVCGQEAALSIRELRSNAATDVDNATIVSVTLDDVPVKDVKRAQSRIFAISLPETNVFDSPCESLGGVPAGIYFPAVADGYYLRLKPLSAGDHTLEFKTEGSIQQDIRYTLKVTPVILK